MNDFSDLTIIIPTLNENRNIVKLLGELQRNYKGIRLIVADDGSTDGTKESVIKICRKSRNVKFLDRKNNDVQGLTASVIDAAMLVRTSKTLVMDGDMQHPVDRVGIISKALDDTDVAIGVRSSVRNWGVSRRVISALANGFVYSVFAIRGKPKVPDMMSGFFGIRSSLFKRLVKTRREAFVLKGYKVLLDILRIIDKNALIAVVYYSTFHKREHGKSKLGMHQFPNVLRSTLR